MSKTLKNISKKIGVGLAAVMFMASAASVIAPAQASAGGVCNDVPTYFKFRCPGSLDNESANVDNNPIFYIALFLLDIVAAGVAIVAVGAIIFGGITYSSSQGNPQQSQKGITIITNAVIGILAFIFMYALLNFIVPGGLFR